MIYKALTSIIPSRLIYQNKLYSIISIDDDYIINKYEIYLDNYDRIENIHIDANHVNSDPDTDLFCLPEDIKQRQLSNKLIREIEIIMETYNLNNCYYTPWSYIKYGEYNSDEYFEKSEERYNSLIMKSFRLINKIRNFNIDIEGD